MADSSKIADVLNALAEAQMEYGDLLEAEENFTEALRIATDNENQGEILIYQGNLAELALAQRDWTKAEKLALEALKLAEEIGQQEEIAQDNYRIARALLLQGNASLASSYALKSVNIYTRLRHPYLPEAVEVLMRSREERPKKIANN
jgi:tetratricopeptide (TPR) repeat protein